MAHEMMKEQSEGGQTQTRTQTDTDTDTVGVDGKNKQKQGIYQTADKHQTDMKRTFLPHVEEMQTEEKGVRFFQGET